MKTTPFQINVSQDVLDDLRSRLVRARVPATPAGVGWSMGVDAGCGGHHSSWEVPEAFAADLRSFLRALRALSSTVSAAP
jgi:hypothetical protein